MNLGIFISDYLGNKVEDLLAHHSEIIDTDPELRNNGYGIGKFSIIIPAFVLK